MEILQERLTCLVENEATICGEGPYDFTIEGAGFKVEKLEDFIEIVLNIEDVYLKLGVNETLCLKKYRYRLSPLLILFESHTALKHTEKAKLFCESIEILFEKMTEAVAFQETEEFIENHSFLEPRFQVNDIHLSIPNVKLKFMLKLCMTLKILHQNTEKDDYLDRHEILKHTEELIELFNSTQTGSYLDYQFITCLLLVNLRTNNGEMTIIINTIQSVMQKMTEHILYITISNCLSYHTEDRSRKIQTLRIFQKDCKLRFMLTLCMTQTLLDQCRKDESKFRAFKNDDHITKLIETYQSTEMKFFLSPFLKTKYLRIVIQVLVTEQKFCPKQQVSIEAQIPNKEMERLINSLADLWIFEGGEGRAYLEIYEYLKNEDGAYFKIYEYLKNEDGAYFKIYEYLKNEDGAYFKIYEYLKYATPSTCQFKSLNYYEANLQLCIVLFKLCIIERLLDQWQCKEEKDHSSVLQISELIQELKAMHQSTADYLTPFLKERYLVILFKVYNMESHSKQAVLVPQEMQNKELSNVVSLIEEIMPQMQESEIYRTIFNYCIPNTSWIPFHLKNLPFFESDTRLGLILKLCLTERYLDESRVSKENPCLLENPLNILELNSMYQLAQKGQSISEFLTARFLVTSLKLCLTEQNSHPKHPISTDIRFTDRLEIYDDLISKTIQPFNEEEIYSIIHEHLEEGYTEALQKSLQFQSLGIFTNSKFELILKLSLTQRYLDQSLQVRGKSSELKHIEYIRMLYLLDQKTETCGFLKMKYNEIMLQLLLIEKSCHTHKGTTTEMHKSIVSQACDSLQAVLSKFNEKYLYKILYCSLKSFMQRETNFQINRCAIFEKCFKTEFMLKLCITEILFEQNIFSTAFDSLEELITLYKIWHQPPTSFWFTLFTVKKVLHLVLQYYITLNCKCHARHVSRQKEKLNLVIEWLDTGLEDFEKETYEQLDEHLSTHCEELPNFQLENCNLYKSESNSELKLMLHLAMVKRNDSELPCETGKIKNLIIYFHSLKWENGFTFAMNDYLELILELFFNDKFSNPTATKSSLNMLIYNSLETLLNNNSYEMYVYRLIQRFLDHFWTTDYNELLNNMSVYETNSKLEFMLKLCMTEKLLENNVNPKENSYVYKRIVGYLFNSFGFAIDRCIMEKYWKIEIKFLNMLSSFTKNADLKALDIRKYLCLDEEQKGLWLECKNADADPETKEKLQFLIVSSFDCNNRRKGPEYDEFNYRYLEEIKDLSLDVAILISDRKNLLQIFLKVLAYILQKVAPSTMEKTKKMTIETFIESLKIALNGQKIREISEVIQFINDIHLSQQALEGISVQMCIQLLRQFKKDYHAIAKNMLDVCISRQSQNSEIFLSDMIFKLIGFPSSCLIKNSMHSLEMKKQIFEQTFLTATESSECTQEQFHILQSILSKIERKWQSVQETYAKKENQRARETRKKLRQAAMLTLLVIQMVIISSNGEHKSAKLKKYLVLKYEYDKSILYLLWCSGDIEKNPGPPLKRNLLAYDSEKIRRWTQEMSSNLLKIYWGFVPSTKQKNLWQHKPDEWPDSVPFYDTKNKTKDENGRTISDHELLKHLKKCCDKKGVIVYSMFNEELSAWNYDKQHLVFKLHILRLECHKIRSAVQEIALYIESDDLKQNLNNQEVFLNIHASTQCFGPLDSKHNINITREIAILLCKMVHGKNKEDKCERIWDEPPDDWPSDILLFDPNNRGKYKKKYQDQKLCSVKQLTETFLRLPILKNKLTLPEYKVYKPLLEGYQSMIEYKKGKERTKHKDILNKMFSIHTNTTQLAFSLKNLHEAGLFDKEVQAILTSWWTCHKIDSSDDEKLACIQTSGKRPHVTIDLFGDFLQISLSEPELEKDSYPKVHYNIPLQDYDRITCLKDYKASTTHSLMQQRITKDLSTAASNSDGQQSSLRPQKYSPSDTSLDHQPSSAMNFKCSSNHLGSKPPATKMQNSESIGTYRRLRTSQTLCGINTISDVQQSYTAKFSLLPIALQDKSNYVDIIEPNSNEKENVGNIPLVVLDTAGIMDDDRTISLHTNISNINADDGNIICQSGLTSNCVQNEEIDTKLKTHLEDEEINWKNCYHNIYNKTSDEKLNSGIGPINGNDNQESFALPKVGPDNTEKRKSSREEGGITSCNKKLILDQDNEYGEEFTTQDWEQVINDFDSDLSTENNINISLNNIEGETASEDFDCEQINQSLENFVQDLIDYESGKISEIDRILADQT